MAASVWSSLGAFVSSSTKVRPSSSSSPAESTEFFGSQLGGRDVLNYSYTDMPWTLMAHDVVTFFKFGWALPYILLPLTPTDSGDLCELSPTRKNLVCIFIHTVICVMQLCFLLAIPFVVLLLPGWIAALGFLLFMLVNGAICGILNGDQIEYHSDAQFAPALPEHSHEQWIFVNGVAVGETWMMSNLNRLAMTFKRPVLGIHNKTSGIIFDVIECLVQRNLGYATEDVRVCFKRVQEKLYDPGLDKVVLILHSQGGIIGSLVIDWLIQELPQDILAKLEVFTFGNAANHCSNPIRHVQTEHGALDHPVVASVDAAVVAKAATTRHGLDPKQQREGHRPPTPVSPDSSPSPPVDHAQAKPRPSNFSLVTSKTSSIVPVAASDRAIGHIEHYAHTTDFVSLWGVLHFATAALGNKTMPRFTGRVFAQTSPRGGHQFCQHYLDLAFPLARDPATGEFVGCAEEGNAFMESEVVIGSAGDESSGLREAMGTSWLGWAFDEQERADGERRETEVTLHASSPVETQQRGRRRSRSHGNARTYKVKELSRLWLYRNGKSPRERPPLLVRGAD